MASTKTIKSAGGDYTSLAAWEDAMDGDLTGTGVAEAICYSLDDTTPVTIAGWTTTASDDIWIHADSTGRHAGVWDGDKYNLSVTDENVLRNEEDYLTIDGVQFNTVSPTSNLRRCFYDIAAHPLSANAIVFKNCIFKGHGHATYTQSLITINSANGRFYFINCDAYGASAITGNRILSIDGDADTRGYAYNCTLVGGEYVIRPIAGTTVVKNTYCGGSSVEDYGYYGGTFAKTNCASSDTSASDAGGTETATDCVNSVPVSTDTFVNVTPGSEDFHLAAGSALIGAGVDTSGDAAPLNFTTDIDGDTRS